MFGLVGCPRLPRSISFYISRTRSLKVTRYAALAEAEADRPGIISPSDALNAAREAAELARSLPLRLVIEATPANALAADSQALCDQITCLLISLVGEPFGQLDRALLATLRYRGALALGLLPSDLRVGG